VQPKLTVLMAVGAYRERYLNEAVGSIVAQTCPHWRLLVITEERQRAELKGVLAGHPADPRIAVIANERPQLAAKLNTGMKRAETEFVAILHGDDMWSPEAVEVLVSSIAACPEIDFFHSSRRFIDDGGRPVSSVYRSRPLGSLADFLVSSPVKHLLCWRREKGLAIGGMDESMDVAVDDFDFPWSMAEHGATFKAVPECLYIYRDHRECFRLTTHVPMSHRTRGMARIMRKHGADRSAIAARLARAERGYLRQCLFRSRFDRWMKSRRGYDPQRGWRETYQ
jgi:glycosyltransferase involved in cell wall biosynthesis